MSRIRFDGCDLSPRGARTPRYAQRIAAVSLAALLVAAAACGGGGGRLSKSDYEHRINAAGQRLSAVFGLVDENTPNLHQFAVKVDRARRTLDDVTSDLGDVKPPEKAEPAHEQLVGSLRELSVELRNLAAAARSGSKKRTDLARRDLSAPARGILQAIQELQQAGFDVNRGTS
jgi:hypothetical protein